MTAIVARARGLAGRLLTDATLADIERARDAHTLAGLLARAGLATGASADAVERALRERFAGELAILAAWTEREELAALELDEDRRSLRNIVRGLVAGITGERRIEAATATSRLGERVLAQLAIATSIDELADVLERAEHPLAGAFADDADLIAIELALVRRFVAASARVRDPAMRLYITQLVDIENAIALPELVTRGRSLDVERMFVSGGKRITRPAFVAATDSLAACDELVATAFAHTPLAAGVTEDAALAWQLATQARLRMLEPHGLAPVIYFVLRRRAEIRRVRRTAWRLAFGGAA